MNHGLNSTTIAAIAAAAIAAPLSAGVPDGYATVEQLERRCRELADASERCMLARYGRSFQRRPLLALTLSGEPATAGDRPALLLAAGLDGRHRVGTEVAVRIAERLVAEHPDLLDEATVYVLPLMNPDGLALNEGLDLGHRGTLRPVDEDRDARSDEDGPDDLDGDGVITMMRFENPPLTMAATHVEDPAESRLLVEADAAKGQRPKYAVLVEGRDYDGDGAVAEDGPGGVDANRNFMHEWPEHALDAGIVQLSEPETHAAARFVLEHPNIVAAIVYGPHDTVVSVPSGKGSDVSGRAPKLLAPEDVPLYEEVAELYGELTGQKRADGADSDGSFHAWLYAQQGIPTFATTAWGRPDPETMDDRGEEAAKPDEDVETPAGKPADPEAAAWLAYADALGQGFVAWSPVEHPTYGRVEVGGFVPGFRMNPPGDELEELAGGQTAFAAALLERRPRLSIPEPTVRRLGPGLYEVHLAIVNDGYLPTATARARDSRAVMPTVVRLSLPLEAIVAGDAVTRHWSIDGSGRRVVHHWILRVEDGATVAVDVHNRQLGKTTVTIVADGGEEDER